ncbi:hypothetical protein GCM10010174_65500 [Kutzneria viridogrisea]|uniref:Small-conductance mechanosensitive channel n=1 Tax=Kutzneria viridogrisea TaxID=47990 RepID=A0ABR6BZ57_9PSEU|nr:small-conductance mechanosensitive channel [Kutzneria viridogrisea]
MTTTHDEVSPQAASALREAMNRLLIGQSRHTNGQLTKANLGREARLSHATVHRAKTILKEWDEAVAACGGTTAQQLRHDGETADLRARLATKTQECRELHRQLEAAATVIATLHHENTALRALLNRQGTVVPLGIRHATAELEPVP